MSDDSRIAIDGEPEPAKPRRSNPTRSTRDSDPELADAPLRELGGEGSVWLTVVTPRWRIRGCFLQSKVGDRPRIRTLADMPTLQLSRCALRWFRSAFVLGRRFASGAALAAHGAGLANRLRLEPPVERFENSDVPRSSSAVKPQYPGAHQDRLQSSAMNSEKVPRSEIGLENHLTWSVVRSTVRVWNADLQPRAVTD